MFSIHALQRWTNPFLWLFCHHQFLLPLSLFVIFLTPILFPKVIFSYQTLNNVSNGIFKIMEVPEDRAAAHIPPAESGSAGDLLRV
jgi:hypothetical protein